MLDQEPLRTLSELIGKRSFRQALTDSFFDPKLDALAEEIALRQRILSPKPKEVNSKKRAKPAAQPQKG